MILKIFVDPRHFDVHYLYYVILLYFNICTNFLHLLITGGNYIRLCLLLALSLLCFLFSPQMLSVSQTAGSPAVSLVYTVRNGTVLLNGTTASNLLGQLSAELVGYFLFYPPLMIAERKLRFAF